MFEAQDKWERRSTIRSRPRIIYDTDAQGYFYPISRQPLAIHPFLVNKGVSAVEYLLAQSFYKYSNDIAVIETKVVNNTILQIINNQLPIEFTKEQKLSLYTIMVDEAYHAYIAYDTMLQIEHNTGIKPLALPKVIEIEKAIISVTQTLDEKYHEIFKIICVCLAENTLTKEIVSMTDKTETHPFFQRVLQDHLADETRHSGIFFHLLKYIWSILTDDYKKAISEVLVEFIIQYLDITVQREFDKQILLNLDFTINEVDTMLKDVYNGFKLTNAHPMLNNILNLLERCEMLDKFTLPKLKAIDWI